MPKYQLDFSDRKGHIELKSTSQSTAMHQHIPLKEISRTLAFKKVPGMGDYLQIFVLVQRSVAIKI
jgi:hypothetical protein